MQTEMQVEDYLEIKIRQADKDQSHRAQEQMKVAGMALEERMARYRQDVERGFKEEFEAQIAKFKEMELASLKIEERTKYQHDLAEARLEFEQKLAEARKGASAALDEERARLKEREKEMEQGNIELRQQILEQSNRAIMKETHLRNEADLQVKELQMEKDALSRRYEEAQAHLADFQNFKERYSNKMQEAMAQYKIDINREHAGVLSAVEIDKARIEAERVTIREREANVEKMMSQISASRQEAHEAREQVKELQKLLAGSKLEAEEAKQNIRELQLKART
ncbi:hypothetical protein BDK51DRAFT_33451 [Blyttiomyces helicus]|uniref:Uncharacterized protein n=1 Tax=Blyttiomyces helicus TaxID=388810 RepID=A0A4P9W0J5_9FUNG|nr:hypothetical protein BDK51DRAFT_33451 [Blyttiomyces helicus]|eukprot:RKO83546.1 hypothetical protein BDK51DRAFT_33451 [Blyttiomyces helicus]